MGKKLPLPNDIEAAAGAAAAAGVWAPPPSAPQPESWMSWLVPLFSLANAGFFVYSMYVNDCPSTHPTADSCVFTALGRFAFEPLPTNRLLGPSTFTLDKLGALDYKKVVLEGEWWRLLSCIWLHAGVIHLLVNIISLLFIGVRLEQEFGFVKIGTLYVLSGFGGSLMSCLYMREISVGASGAIFGLLGAMLSELITNWTIYANKCAALLTLILVIAINMAIGALPHVDNSAHIGGFVSGFLLGFILLMRPQFGWVNRKHIPPGYELNHVKPKHKGYQYVLWFTALFVLIIGYVISLLKISRLAKQ